MEKIALGAFSENWRAEHFFSIFSNSSCIGYGLTQSEAEPTLVAYVLGYLIYGDFELISIATDSNFRGKGCAKTLLSFLMEKPTIQRIFLEVATTNLAAISLYKKLGFEITGVRPRYYQGKIDAILMKKTTSFLKNPDLGPRGEEAA